MAIALHPAGHKSLKDAVGLGHEHFAAPIRHLFLHPFNVRDGDLRTWQATVVKRALELLQFDKGLAKIGLIGFPLRPDRRLRHARSIPRWGASSAPAPSTVSRATVARSAARSYPAHAQNISLRRGPSCG